VLRPISRMPQSGPSPVSRRGRTANFSPLRRRIRRQRRTRASGPRIGPLHIDRLGGPRHGPLRNMASSSSSPYFALPSRQPAKVCSANALGVSSDHDACWRRSRPRRSYERVRQGFGRYRITNMPFGLVPGSQVPRINAHCAHAFARLS
jgi:hypothetical protein